MRTKTPKAPAISEAQFQRTVIEAARRLGWLVHHVRPGRNARGRWMTAVSGDVGFPDIVATKDRVVYVELKSRSGQPSKEQVRWMDRLTAAGAEVYLWRPADWDAILGVFSGNNAHTSREPNAGGRWCRTACSSR